MPDAAGDALARLVVPSRRVHAALADRAPRWLEAGVDPQALADHLRDLALRFAEPLLTRRRAAAGAAWPAVRDLYTPDTLPNDLAAAAAAVWHDSLAHFERRAAGTIRARRLRRRGARVVGVSEHESRGLRRRVARPAERLLGSIGRLRAATAEPDWRRARARLEERWADAWEAMALELLEIWHGELTPRLRRLRRLRAGWPGWLITCAAAAAALLAFLFLLPS